MEINLLQSIILKPISMYVCTYVCMYACTYVMYVCMCACMYASTYVRAYIHTVFTYTMYTYINRL